MPASVTSVAEVTHVSKHGLWLLLDSEELLVPFEHFAWVRERNDRAALGCAVAYCESSVLAGDFAFPILALHSRWPQEGD